MFHNCEGQSHKTMSTDHNFWRERRAESDSNRGPSAYQPNALPLGQTGSLSLAGAATSIIFCRDETSIIFVATKQVSFLSRQNKYHFCRDKTRLLSRQKHTCRDKTYFFATNITLITLYWSDHDPSCQLTACPHDVMRPVPIGEHPSVPNITVTIRHPQLCAMSVLIC